MIKSYHKKAAIEVEFPLGTLVLLNNSRSNALILHSVFVRFNPHRTDLSVQFTRTNYTGWLSFRGVASTWAVRRTLPPSWQDDQGRRLELYIHEVERMASDVELSSGKIKLSLITAVGDE